MTAYLGYITPKAFSAAYHVYSNYSKVNTYKAAPSTERVANVNQHQINEYNNAKTTLWNVAIAAAGCAVYAKFGSKLGDYKCAAVSLGAVAFSGSLEHAVLTHTVMHGGANVLKAVHDRNYSALVKNAGLIFASLLASADATRAAVWNKVAPYTMSV